MMDGHANSPSGLPHEHPIRSYWWPDPPDPIADHRTTPDLPSRADMVIVGSGISGSTIAYNLLSAKPELDVVLLEARQAASGASGRNGGHTKTASYRSFLDNLSTHGADDAIKIAKLEYNCMKSVHAFIRQHNIQCDNVECDTVDIFYDQTQLSRAKDSVAMMQKLMGKDCPRYTFYSPAETAEKFLIPNSLGSLTYEAGSLNAYLCTIGILKLALGKSLNLQTNTPVLSITPPTNPSEAHTITTSRGQIAATTVILATNGFTPCPSLLPSLAGTITPFRGIVTAHRPGLRLPQTGLPTTYSFIYDTGYEYMITRPPGSRFAGDIVIGGGLTQGHSHGVAEFNNTDDTAEALDPDITRYLHATTERYFASNWGADHPDGRVRHTWSGTMGYSADAHPLVGQIPATPGLWVHASFQGHGMVLCFLCARALAAMVLGPQGRDQHGLAEWFPSCFRVSQQRLDAMMKEDSIYDRMMRERSVTR